MYDLEKDMPMVVQSSNLNEELGTVNYVFSDKTGTLTQNIMEFKKFAAGWKSYGSSNPQPVSYAPGVTNVNFYDEQFNEDWTKSMASTGRPQNEYLLDFIRILSVCHTIIVDDKNGVLQYNASSPDELALTNAGRHFGLTFKERDEDGNMVIENKFTGHCEKYELLHVIEFTSARKRMSVIVRDPQGRIMLMTKGADSHIVPRLRSGQEDMVSQTETYLSDYAKDGLRTLILAQREIDPSYFSEWSMRYSRALASMVDREQMMDKCSEEIEQGLELVGATAIEDKLQEDVGEVIEHIREAGVKVWVLTGDKIETAINIGYSCRLIDEEMELFIIDKLSTNDIFE